MCTLALGWRASVCATLSITARSGGFGAVALSSNAKFNGTSTRIAPSSSATMATGVPSNNCFIQLTSAASTLGGGWPGLGRGGTSAGAFGVLGLLGALGVDGLVGVVPQAASTIDTIRRVTKRNIGA